MATWQRWSDGSYHLGVLVVDGTAGSAHVTLFMLPDRNFLLRCSAASRTKFDCHTFHLIHRQQQPSQFRRRSPPSSSRRNPQINQPSSVPSRPSPNYTKSSNSCTTTAAQNMKGSYRRNSGAYVGHRWKCWRQDGRRRRQIATGTTSSSSLRATAVAFDSLSILPAFHASAAAPPLR